MSDIIDDIPEIEKEGSTGKREIQLDSLSREELERQLQAFRKKDRRKMFVFGLVTAAMLSIGTIVYVANEAGSAPFPGSYGSYGDTGGYGSGGYGSYAGYQYAIQDIGGAAGGGCCGGGGAVGGGGCGSGSAAASNAPLADLEKQALEQYKEETGRTDVTAKAGDFGCHTQIDILDADGKVVRSYGFQGGPLYVIN